MIRSFEDLFLPIEPQPGPEAVLQSTLDPLVHELRALGDLFHSMAVVVGKVPLCDELFDGLDQTASTRMESARRAFMQFRAGRDCKGTG